MARIPQRLCAAPCRCIPPASAERRSKSILSPAAHSTRTTGHQKPGDADGPIAPPFAPSRRCISPASGGRTRSNSKPWRRSALARTQPACAAASAPHPSRPQQARPSHGPGPPLTSQRTGRCRSPRPHDHADPRRTSVQRRRRGPAGQSRDRRPAGPRLRPARPVRADGRPCSRSRGC